MPLSNHTNRASIGRYRPVLYIATGIAAAYAILLIHRHFYPSPPSPSGLRRRNAVRRRPSRRGEHPSVSQSGSHISTSIHAIRRLQQLEAELEPYGTFRVEVENGRSFQCALMPSEFPTNEELQQILDIGIDQAVLMRRMMEDAFLENFFAFEYLPSYVISRANGEYQYLMDQLLDWGFTERNIARIISRFNGDPNFGEDLRRRRNNGEPTTLAISSNSLIEESREPIDTTADDQSMFSWRDGSDEAVPSREGQSLLNLLYHIAEDQARRDGYIHRGVTCNSCGIMPIQGIRYRCANCVDYDLCEACESLQGHLRTHLFFKVRIPAPFLGNFRQSQPVCYPGKPMLLPRNLPRPLAKRLMKETNFESTELDALWDQFRCLANVDWPMDPNKLNMAIDRRTFDRCFVPNTSARPPPPSLIYDRMFAFYDTNGDNLIGFEEFLKGLASFKNKSTHERLRRVFYGYDIDRDGYVERKDFLRIFRAYYTLSREVTRDLIAGIEDDFIEGGMRDVILGSQPISSAFHGAIPAGDLSRPGEGKRRNLHGDMQIIDNQGVLRDDREDDCDRHAVIGDAAVRSTYGRSRPTWLRSSSRPRPSDSYRYGERGHEHDDDDEDDLSDYTAEFEEWPNPNEVQPQDIINALGAYVPYEEITDHVDRARIGTCVVERIHCEDQEHIEGVRRAGIEDRWRRRQFYIDEEDGATAPPGYHNDEEDAVEEDDEVQSHVPSFRSRSSSKVRFQDDVTDNECETRSNPSTSSRSIPIGERWGGIEIPEAERDVGKEILYQVTQQGLNELLDLIFKPKEDLVMEAYRTRAERKRWNSEIEHFAMVQFGHSKTRDNKAEQETAADELRIDFNDTPPKDKPLQQLLDESGYHVESEPQEHELLTSPVAEDYQPQDDSQFTDLQSPSGDIELEPFPLAPANMPLESENGEAENTSGRTYPRHDPTLPQFRPDSVDTPTTPTDIFSNEASSVVRTSSPIYESPSISASGSSTPEPPRLRLRFQQPDPDSASSSTSACAHPPSSFIPETHKRPDPPPPAPPSPTTLARWYRLNQIELEVKERGGSGAKLNFEEFARRMQGDRGKRLAFVGSWIDLISF